MSSLFKLVYALVALLALSAIWIFLLPDDMMVELKVRLVGYVSVVFVVYYFVIKNIIYKRDE